MARATKALTELALETSKLVSFVPDPKVLEPEPEPVEVEELDPLEEPEEAEPETGAAVPAPEEAVEPDPELPASVDSELVDDPELVVEPELMLLADIELVVPVSGFCAAPLEEDEVVPADVLPAVHRYHPNEPGCQ